jgi:hypothetical protein
MTKEDIDQEFEAFFTRLVENDNHSQLEKDVLKECKYRMRQTWNEFHKHNALQRLRLASYLVPCNMVLERET